MPPNAADCRAPLAMSGRIPPRIQGPPQATVSYGAERTSSVAWQNEPRDLTAGAQGLFSCRSFSTKTRLTRIGPRHSHARHQLLHTPSSVNLSKTPTAPSSLRIGVVQVVFEPISFFSALSHRSTVNWTRHPSTLKDHRRAHTSQDHRHGLSRPDPARLQRP